LLLGALLGTPLDEMELTMRSSEGHFESPDGADVAIGYRRRACGAARFTRTSVPMSMTIRSSLISTRPS
jgi:hypothetical protein